MDWQKTGDGRAGDETVKPQSVLAVYLLFWMLTLFAVLPFGVRTSHDDGSESVPGQASSAPSNPMIGKKLLWTTLISGVLFALFLANYTYGWITVDDVPFWRTRGPYAPGPSA